MYLCFEISKQAIEIATLGLVTVGVTYAVVKLIEDDSEEEVKVNPQG